MYIYVHITSITVLMLVRVPHGCSTLTIANNKYHHHHHNTGVSIR